jgi:undecaprenyl phosphate N,N'-diacetylbacillosamine 1-phosphate transferase
MYHSFFKRVIDIVGSLVALIVFSLVLFVVSIWLSLANRGDVLFRQERPGHRGKLFRIYKFKTMNDARDSAGNLLPDNQRLTKAGAFVRKWSLDELPQLVNVLVGDMSLVGPRPLLVRYLPLYNQTQTRRHDVRPGITGWAQVNGRNSISWEKKFELDVYYVDHLSFKLDMHILLLTLKKVLFREGVNQSEQRPMEPFNGYN